MRKTDVENLPPPDKGLLQLTSVQVLKTLGLDYRADFQDYIKQKQHIDLHFQDLLSFTYLSYQHLRSVHKCLHQIATQSSFYQVFYCVMSLFLSVCAHSVSFFFF